MIGNHYGHTSLIKDRIAKVVIDDISLRVQSSSLVVKVKLIKTILGTSITSIAGYLPQQPFSPYVFEAIPSYYPAFIPLILLLESKYQ